jgi:hypothetical protein
MENQNMSVQQLNPGSKSPVNSLTPPEVLSKAREIMLSKGRDYQNPASSVRQADYYANGILTIHDILHAKMTRAKSLIETARNDPDYKVNHESLADSFVDMINYAAFAVSWLSCGIDGQELSRDMFNREVVVKAEVPSNG